MERSTSYNIDPRFNPDNKLEWNKGALDDLAKIAKLAGHITITSAPEIGYHPVTERRLLSSSELSRSNAILEKVFPDCLPSLPLPAAATAATTFFDPESELSIIYLNNEVIEQKARIANPKNPDQGYIGMVNDLTSQHLWRTIQAEKLQAVGDILSKPLGKLRELAFELTVNAAGCALVYGNYRLVEWVTGNPNLSLGERIVSGIPVGIPFLISVGIEAAIFMATAGTIKTSCQTLRDYICYTSLRGELADKLTASLAASRELYLKRPYLVRWK